MQRTRPACAAPVASIVPSLVAALLVAAAAEPARADSFVAVGGGVAFPLGDEDWNDFVESSPTLYVRGGGGKNLRPGARVLVEGSFELTFLSTELDDGALLEADISRYRALLGVRFEQLMTRKILLAVRGGIGIDHLRGEFSSPLFPDRSESDSDTGLAFELAIGPWFSAGSVALGFELALPIGLHDEENFDFRTTDLSLLGGVRFPL
jgi:hypothetical protein